MRDDEFFCGECRNSVVGRRAAHADAGPAISSYTSPPGWDRLVRGRSIRLNNMERDLRPPTPMNGKWLEIAYGAWTLILAGAIIYVLFWPA